MLIGKIVNCNTKSFSFNGNETVKDVLQSLQAKGQFKNTLPQYDIFLSHATIDQAVLKTAKNFFEERGKTVFIAEDYYNENGKSENNINNLRIAMDKSKAFYYLLSPHETVSGFMPWEIGYYDGKYGDKRKVKVLSMDENINFEEAIGRHEFLQLYKNREPLIISGFPGIGRTYLQKHKSDLKILHLDSPDFSWKKNNNGTFVTDVNGKRIRNPEFPNNYIKCLKKAIKGGYDIILISSHDSVRNALNDLNITHALVYPAADMKPEITKRCMTTTVLRNSLPFINKNWEHFINSMKKDSCPNKFELNPGQFLSDIQTYLTKLNNCGRIL